MNTKFRIVNPRTINSNELSIIESARSPMMSLWSARSPMMSRGNASFGGENIVDNANNVQYMNAAIVTQLGNAVAGGDNAPAVEYAPASERYDASPPRPYEEEYRVGIDFSNPPSPLATGAEVAHLTLQETQNLQYGIPKSVKNIPSEAPKGREKNNIIIALVVVVIVVMAFKFFTSKPQ